MLKKKNKKKKKKKAAWRWEGAAWRNETRAWRNETRTWRRAMLKTPRPNTALQSHWVSPKLYSTVQITPCNKVTPPLRSLLPSPVGDLNSEVPVYMLMLDRHIAIGVLNFVTATRNQRDGVTSKRHHLVPGASHQVTSTSLRVDRNSRVMRHRMRHQSTPSKQMYKGL